MKKSILQTLKSEIQGEVFSSKEFTEFYSVDASSYKIIPNMVVIPEHEKDVIRVIKIAKKFKISVTARGAGTGLVGSALNRGIILDMKKFDSIKISKDHVVVGPGVVKGNLDQRLDKVKKFFPPNPSIGSFCSMGGMLGNNSSGSRSLKYGSTIDNVTEITFVDGNAKKITLPENKKISNKIVKLTRSIEPGRFPNTTKNSSGYRIDKVRSVKDTHKIIVGSEGTLGVILSAKIRIKRMPEEKILFVIGYKSTHDASRECLKIKRTNPSAIEFMDKFTLNQIRFRFGKDIECLLYVEYDEDTGTKESELKPAITGKIIKKIEKKYEIEQWWRYRDLSLYHSLRTIKKEKRIPHIIEDAAIPLGNLPKVFSLLDKINKKYKTKCIVYGHAGDGNVHVRLIADRIKIKVIKNIAEEYFDEIIKLGGTITGEHGDGLARSEFVKKQYGAKNYKTFKEIKKIFDPNNILNPGKIISKKSTVISNLETLY